MNTTAATSDLTRAELQAMLNDLRERYLADKQYLEAPIGALAGRYLDTLRFDGYSPKTIRNREQTLGWLAFDHETLAPEDFTYDLLRSFLERHWATKAANTKAMHVSSLRTFFEWLQDYDHLPSNPARKLKTPRMADSERRSHPLETINLLVVSQPDRRDQLAILLMYWCGLRRNELRVIQFRHIDLARRVLTVFGKGGRVLEQSIPEEAALMLERHIQDRSAESEEYLLYPRKIGRTGNYPAAYTYEVVWEDKLRPLSESGIDKWFQRCRARAGLDASESRVVMHELRHTAGTHMQEQGHDLLATQHFLRHKSAAVTERHYIHVDHIQSVARVQRDMPHVLGKDR